MELVTRQSLADTAARRWMDSYGYHINGKGDTPLYGRLNPKAVYAALVALGPTPDPAAVDAAIGNDSWTTVPTCDECGAERLPAVVRMGAEPDYESSTAWLCVGCLQAAVSLVELGTREQKDPTP